MTSESAVRTSTESRAKPVMIAGVVVGSLLIAWLLSLVVGPDAPELGAAGGGDAELTETIEMLLADRLEGHDALSVAVVTSEEVRFAHFGTQVDDVLVDETSSFEIGSVTKPLTGMLLADVIDRGELTADTTVAEAVAPHLALEGDGARVTLEALASHRSGYPRLPRSFLTRSLYTTFTGGDPYTGDADTVLNQAAGVDPNGTEYAYSNLGMAALGDAIAVNQRTDFATLLQDRLLDPIGLTQTVFAGSEQELPKNRTDGSTAGGRSADEWLATGWQPAGIGVWSTASDLAELATAIFDESAPGLAALEPRFSRGEDQQIGYGWLTGTNEDGREITAHGGGTGGFRSWIGLDRDDERAVVVLSNTTRPVDDLGEALLTGGAESLPAEQPDVLGWVFTAFLVVGTAWPLVAAVRHTLEGTGDRHDLVRGPANAIATVVVATAFIPWHLVPDVIWLLAVALTLATTVVVICDWPSTPSTEAGRPMLRWVGTVSTLLTLVAAVVLIA